MRAGKDLAQDRIEVCWGFQGLGSPAGNTPPPQLTLDLLAWILGNRSLGSPTRRQPIPSTYPELTSQEKGEGPPCASTLQEPHSRDRMRASTPPALLRC